MMFAFSGHGKKDNEFSIEALKEKPARYENLFGVSYYRGGGMEGNSNSFSLSFEDGDYVLLTDNNILGNRYHRFCLYRVDENLMDELNAYVKEYNLSIWNELPESDLIALDAPSEVLVLTFESDGTIKNVSINYERQFPEGGYKVVNEFVKKITSQIDDKNLIEFYFGENEDTKVYVGKDVENTDDEIREMVNVYWRNENMSAFFYDDSLQISSDESKQYVLKDIVHENLDDKDSSWYMEFVEQKDEDDRIWLTMDGMNLYIKGEAFVEVLEASYN